MALNLLESTERAILSSCLNNLDKGWHGHVSRVGGNNPETLFEDPKNQATFKIIDDIFTRGLNPTIPVIADELSKKYDALFETDPEEFLMDVSLSIGMRNLDQLDSGLGSLKKARENRRLLKAIQLVSEDMQNVDINVEPEDVVERLNEIVQETETSTSVERFKDVAADVFSSSTPMWSQSTGIKKLDEVLGGGGFESGTLNVIAARPKVGKTIFFNDMIVRIVQDGNVPIVMNLETQKVEFIAKTIARAIVDDTIPLEIEDGEINTGISWGKIKAYLNGKEVPLKKTEIDAIERGKEWALDQDWRVAFDSVMSMQDIQALVAQEKADRPEDTKIVLLVDYLQIQVQDKLHTREELEALTRFYKRLAIHFNIPVILLSQIGRVGEEGKPSAHQTKGSGSIEQDADVVLVLDRPLARHEENPVDCIMQINGTVSRLAPGDEFNVFVDSGRQLLHELTPEQEAALTGGFDDYLSDDGKELI